MPKTVHVYKDVEGWAVKREGKAVSLYSTKKDAVSNALTLIKNSASGQMVVHGKDGRITGLRTHGLPKIMRPPRKSRLGTQKIAKAVSKLVLDRLRSDPISPRA